MAWRSSSSGDSPDRTLADLFAGLAVALLLVLVSLWLQALSDAQQIHKLRAMQKIFSEAFGHLGDGDQDIQVDKARGEITLKAEQDFDPGKWAFKPKGDRLVIFQRARTKLTSVLADIDRGFSENKEAQAKGLRAKDHVEILVVGHTDCRPFSSAADYSLDDNWDLSVLRAASLARFLTEPCQGREQTCCVDGSQACSEGDKHRRLDQDWRVLPAGRGPYEPRKGGVTEPSFGAELPPEVLENCNRMNLDPTWLADQRRVVIQVVPRLDKLMVRD